MSEEVAVIDEAQQTEGEDTALATVPQEVAPTAEEFGLQPLRGMRRFAPEQEAILSASIQPDILEIKPTGEVYLPQVWYRRILNCAFGIGGWGIEPLGDGYKTDDKAVCREFRLWVEGRPVSQVMGEADYIASNDRMTRATACESARSNALMRCAKDLGIALECWDRRATEAWKARYAETYMDNGKKRWRLRSPSSQPQTAAARTGPNPDKQQTEATEGRFQVDKVIPHAGKGWAIRTLDGTDLHTFKPAWAELATDAAESGEELFGRWTIRKTADGVYRNLTELMRAEAQEEK